MANDCGIDDDTILALFDCIESSLKLLRIHVEIPPNLVVLGKAMKILFELILVLALATTQAKHGRLRGSVFVDLFVAHSTPENIKEKWLKEEDIGRVRRRLGRLTQDETQMTVAYNMEVVYGLISNIKVLMDGARGLQSWLNCINSSFRRQGIYTWDSAGSQYGRPLFLGLYSDQYASHHASDRSYCEQITTFVTFYLLVPDSTTYSQVTSCWESFDNGSLLRTPR